MFFGELTGKGYKDTHTYKRQASYNNMIRSMTTLKMATEESKAFAKTLVEKELSEAVSEIRTFAGLESTPPKLKKSLLDGLATFDEADEFCKNKQAALREKVDASISLTGHATVLADKLKTLFAEGTKVVNALQSNCKDQHQNALETREELGIETPEEVKQRLWIFSMPHAEVRAKLNHHQKKSWGTPDRLRDRLLRFNRGTLGGEDEIDDSERTEATDEELEADEAQRQEAQKELDEIQAKEKAEETKRAEAKEDAATKKKAEKAAATKAAAETKKAEREATKAAAIRKKTEAAAEALMAKAGPMLTVLAIIFVLPLVGVVALGPTLLRLSDWFFGAGA